MLKSKLTGMADEDQGGHLRELTICAVIIRILLIISVAEMAIMMVFALVKLELSAISEAMLDAFLLAALSTPFLYYLVISPFVRVRDEAKERVRFMALHDPLTDLPNRRLLEEHMLHTQNECSRNNCFGILILLDLDGFKPINDTYGHEAGDAVLKDVASTLKSVLRSTDLAARLGGDEFVVLIGGHEQDPLLTLESAKMIAEKIRLRISHTIDFNGDQLSVSSSLGVRLIPPEYCSIESLLRDADTAMYEAKKAGRSQVKIAPV